jgi:hypothetical protein
MKWNLYKVRLNNAGYDVFGRYYGRGKPLWRALPEAGDPLEFRAPDRQTAKSLVRVKDPTARFYR